MNKREYFSSGAKELLSIKKIIFWDFDGVIKETLKVKEKGFVEIFKIYGEKYLDKIREHHQNHGGVSRNEKIKLYLRWYEVEYSNEIIEDLEKKFAEYIYLEVINANWVPGVREYLESNHRFQSFYILTGTPQTEIEKILKELKIDKYFKGIYGSPSNKKLITKMVLAKTKCELRNALIVGDSYVDYEAAIENNIAFILRKTEFNRELQNNFKGCSFDEL